jgi:ribosome-associated protein
LLSDEEKSILITKLSNHLTKEGFLKIRSSVHRTQLANKEDVIKKVNRLIHAALSVKKARIATKPHQGSLAKKKEDKKRHAEKKQSRKKWSF